MAIEKKSLIPSTSAPKSTASKLANTKKVNDKVSAASALRTAGIRHAKLVPAKTGGTGHAG